MIGPPLIPPLIFVLGEDVGICRTSLLVRSDEIEVRRKAYFIRRTGCLVGLRRTFVLGKPSF